LGGIPGSQAMAEEAGMHISNQRLMLLGQRLQGPVELV
jgi:hypothetical protein